LGAACVFQNSLSDPETPFPSFLRRCSGCRGPAIPWPCDLKADWIGLVQIEGMEDVLEELRENKSFKRRVIPAVENGPSQDSDVTRARRPPTPTDAGSEAEAEPQTQAVVGSRASSSSRGEEVTPVGTWPRGDNEAESLSPPTSPFQSVEVGRCHLAVIQCGIPGDVWVCGASDQ
jgi:hypothetical protein